MNKRAIVSDSITWVLASLIIIAIILISFFFVKAQAAKKEFLYDSATDLIALKSFIGLLLSSGETSGSVFDEIVQNKKISPVNGKFVTNVMGNFYSDRYPKEIRFAILDYDLDKENSVPLELADIGYNLGDLLQTSILPLSSDYRKGTYFFFIFKIDSEKKIQMFLAPRRSK